MSSNRFAGHKIALGVCGGIAAYKAAALARELTRGGADVSVVMTPSATEFVGPITFSTLTGNPVRTELFPENAPTKIPHTDLGRTCDLVIIAPATAKIIAKCAQGISDDLMSALLLSAACPVVMAPAMHSEMWNNQATRLNVATVQARGVRLVGPNIGALAGPDTGAGRMAEVHEIVEAAAEELERRKQLDGVKLVITAAGTREPIDVMRFIGNASSGMMGYELAYEAARRGGRVTLISGPASLVPPEQARVFRVTTAAGMRQAVLDEICDARVLIMAAAVSDWKPVHATGEKLSKSSGPPRLELEPTPDILAEVGESRHAGTLPALEVLVGFCAETGDLQEAAAGKLKKKKLDLAVANLVGAEDSGAAAPTLRALILDREGHLDDLGVISKRALARRILDKVAGRLG